MGVSANFGVKTAADTAGIDAVIDRLGKILYFLKSLEKKSAGVFSGMGAAAQKMSQVAVDSDGKIVASKQASTERIKQAITQQVAAGESASNRLQEITERRTNFEKQAESQKYEAAKASYKELVTAHQNMTTAMQEATSKEVKAELKEQLAALKAEKQAYAD